MKYLERLLHALLNAHHQIKKLKMNKLKFKLILNLVTLIIKIKILPKKLSLMLKMNHLLDNYMLMIAYILIFILIKNNSNNLNQQNPDKDKIKIWWTKWTIKEIWDKCQWTWWWILTWIWIPIWWINNSLWWIETIMELCQWEVWQIEDNLEEEVIWEEVCNKDLKEIILMLWMFNNLKMLVKDLKLKLVNNLLHNKLNFILFNSLKITYQNLWN